MTRHRPLLASVVALGLVVSFAPRASAAVPGAPTITGVTPASGSLQVSFSAGSGATSHTYAVNGGSSTATGGSNPFTIGSLTNGEISCVTVTAQNSDGSSAASNSRCGVPNNPSTVASAKPVISGITATATSLSVTYTRADDGFAIQEYQVWLDGSYFTSIYDFASPMTIPGLSAGTEYSVQIKAQGPGTAPDSTKSDPYVASTSATSSSGPRLEDVYPTAYLDPNGGTCSVDLMLTKALGRNGMIELPTPQQCSRDGYVLAGWTPPAGAAPLPDFPPGSWIPIGDESFTMRARWLPIGAEVVYDANVAFTDACRKDGRDVTGFQRFGVGLLTPQKPALATDAPCAPPGYTLKGWRIDGTTYLPGDALPAALLQGRTIRATAVWQAYAVTIVLDRTKLAAGEESVATILTTELGRPVSAPIGVWADGLAVIAVEGTRQWRDHFAVRTNASGIARVLVRGTFVDNAPRRFEAIDRPDYGSSRLGAVWTDTLDEFVAWGSPDWTPQNLDLGPDKVKTSAAFEVTSTIPVEIRATQVPRFTNPDSFSPLTRGLSVTTIKGARPSFVRYRWGGSSLLCANRTTPATMQGKDGFQFSQNVFNPVGTARSEVYLLASPSPQSASCALRFAPGGNLSRTPLRVEEVGVYDEGLSRYAWFTVDATVRLPEDVREGGKEGFLPIVSCPSSRRVVCSESVVRVP